MPIKDLRGIPLETIMKVNDPNLSSLAAAEAAKAQAAQAPAAHARKAAAGAGESKDDVHLSELVRSLRTLAAESPERQAYVEKIAKDYAKGTYKVDASATAAKIIADMSRHGQVSKPK
jgi:flagellar biosynthesis anti-sigma factor FlgM